MPEETKKAPIRLELVDKTLTTDAPVVEEEMERTWYGKDYIVPFKRNKAETLDHCVAIATVIAERENAADKEAGSTAESVLSRGFTGWLDLKVRSEVASTASNSAVVKGVASVIEAGAKGFVIAGLAATIEEARALVIEQRRAKGLPVE